MNIALEKPSGPYLTRIFSFTTKGSTTPLYSPLFVPSISSTLHPNLGDVLKNLSSLPSGRDSMILVSAFDVAGAKHAPKGLGSFRGVILDSGGYEARRLQKPWKKAQFERVARRFKADIVVGFDEDYLATKKSWKAQVDQQVPFLSGLSGKCLRTLLLHVDLRGAPLEKLTAYLATVAESYDILGIVEKDLGLHFADRIAGIADLRSEMDRINLSRPIHIFGVDDPFSLIAYTLAGADIFDGLGWFTECMDPRRLARHDLGHVALLDGWDAFSRKLKGGATNPDKAQVTLSAALEWNLRTIATLMADLRQAVLHDDGKPILKMLSGSALQFKGLLGRIKHGR
jgi:hypothetical protein